MNKKWMTSLIILPSLLSSITAFSTPSPAFNGSYVGAEFGASLAYANQTIINNTDLNVPIDGITFHSNEPFNLYSSMLRSSAAGSIFAGIGHTWNQFYMSGELVLSNAYYGMASSSISGISRTINIDAITISGNETVTSTANVSPTQFGLFLRPGVMLTPTSLLYARVGTSVINIRYDTTNSSQKTLTIGASGLAFPTTLHANKCITRAALQLGAGLEQAINDKLTLRLDYLYSYYGSIKMYSTQSNNFDTFLITANGSQSVTLNAQSIMLGMAYHFNV